jgi:uncharacterized protein
MDKLDKIKELLTLNGELSSVRRTITKIIDSFKHLVPEKNLENLTEEDLNNISKNIEDKIISVYNNNFTEEEITNIIEFYKSDVGKMYLSKMGKVMIETLSVGQEYGKIIHDLTKRKE